MGGGGSVPTRRPSTADIDINDAHRADKIEPINEPVPFSEDSQVHLSRRVSQFSFSGNRLDGYDGVVTSQTDLVGNDEENKQYSCIRLDENSRAASAGAFQLSASGRNFLSYYEVPVLEIKNLCSSNRYPTKHIELDISLVGIQYGVADAILILPENPTEEVELYAKLFNLNLEETYEFQGNLDEILIPFPSPFTVKQVLTCYLDLMVITNQQIILLF